MHNKSLANSFPYLHKVFNHPQDGRQRDQRDHNGVRRRASPHRQPVGPVGLRALVPDHLLPRSLWQPPRDHRGLQEQAHEERDQPLYPQPGLLRRRDVLVRGALHPPGLLYRALALRTDPLHPVPLQPGSLSLHLYPDLDHHSSR